MVTAVAHTNADAAQGYFTEHLSQNDYYAAGEQRAGLWIGLGAAQMNLQETVTAEAFKALCHNRHPVTHEQLTPRHIQNSTRRVLYDFTCSAPKSVSIIAVTMQDERLTIAHESAARLAFRELERFAGTRVRKDGEQSDRTTGNLVAAQFTHTTSRALDPQLHTHFTVFNATYDKTEGRWKALQTGAMFDATRYASEVYRHELARQVLALGYRIERSQHGWELQGVGPKLRERFSKRAAQRDARIQEMEQRLGRSLSKSEVSWAVHQSRSRKIQGISADEVRQRHLSELSSEERDTLAQLKHQTPGNHPMQVSTPSEAIESGLAHGFERKSVVREHAVLESALSQSYGSHSVDEFKTALDRQPGLIRTPAGLTTESILRTELGLLETVKQGKSACAPLHPTFEPSPNLGKDQDRAIRHVVSSRDRVMGLRGWAGTGKTTALKELARACQEAGMDLVCCAPTSAATDVLRKEGFQATTLQSFLLRPSVPSKTLVLLDEAGAVGVADMEKLFHKTQDARVLLSGDSGQHASVTQGDALRIMEQHSHLTFGDLTEIRRQKRAAYRRVVELAAQGKGEAAFQQLVGNGCVEVVESRFLPQRAAESYVESVSQGRSALLVAPTWEEIHGLNRAVRSTLKAQGKLSGGEQTFRVFDSLSWTEAQKAQSNLYTSGMQVIFRRAAGGFRKGEQLEISVQEGTVQARRLDGSLRNLDVKRFAKSLDVGMGKEIAVSAGDQLLLQANHGKQWLNGERVTVAKMDAGRLHLTDGRVLSRDYRTFTYGYAVTSHAAQGKTVDDVFVSASSRSVSALGSEHFYVSISRGREQCRVFTDDADLLSQRVGRSRQRKAAIEAVPRHNWFQRMQIKVWQRWIQLTQRFSQTQKRSQSNPAQTVYVTHSKRKHYPRTSQTPSGIRI